MTSSRRSRPFARAPRLRTLDDGLGLRKVTWLELFFDLVVVAAIARVGEPFARDYTTGGVVRYLAFFALVWWAWLGQTLFLTRFDPEDLAQRVLTWAQMCAIAVMAANAAPALDTRDAAGFAAASAAVRALLAAQYARAARAEPGCALAARYTAGTTIAAAAWLVAALVPPGLRVWAWAGALTVDVLTPVRAEAHAADAPPHPEHLPERLGLFVLILLGECVVAVMRGIESQDTWTPVAAATAFGSLGALWVLWAHYFDGPALASCIVRSRDDARRFLRWAFAHLPLTAAMAVLGVGLGRVVTHAGQVSTGVGDLALIAVAAATVAISLRAIRHSVSPAAAPS